MHHATLERSARLQKTLDVLLDGEYHTTADIQRHTGSMAPGTDISELRANNIAIDPAKFIKKENGRSIYAYKLSAAASNGRGLSASSPESKAAL